MWSNNYYYIIVGGGLSGLQLALELSRDIFFKGKSVAIIDPNPKTSNDKTWCFWEKGEGKWEDILTKEWKTGKFYSSHLNKSLDLGPYRYKMVRSIDFYNKAQEELRKNKDFHFIRDDISHIDPIKRAATGSKRSYTASHFFDSRIPQEYREDKNYTKIHQHFMGWMIETEEPAFDPSVFTMMDFRLKHKKSTSFTYVLPVTERRALVEFTFFTSYLTKNKVYEKNLKKYIEDILNLRNYSILETEKGIIPMTDFPFHQQDSISKNHITKIGTGGSWVKGSTGYSFKHTEKKVQKIIQNIKQGQNPGKDLMNTRFRLYDSIFLDVLGRKNSLGEELFSKFYGKNSTISILKYLDEETTLSEEVKVMLSLFHPEFIRSFFRRYSADIY